MELDYLQILNIVFIAVAALFTVVEFFVGINRGTLKSLVRLIMLAASAWGAVFLTRYAINNYGGMIYEQVSNVEFFKEMLAGLEELFAASPSLNEYLPIIVLCLVAPIAFFLVFVVLAVLSLIVGAIINFIIGKIVSDKKSFTSRFLGMILSLGCAVIIAGSVLMPITGYLVNASAIYTKLESEGAIEAQNEDGEAIAEALKGSTDLTSVQIADKVTGFVFKSVTEYNTSTGVKGDLVTDLNAIVNVLPSLMNLQEIDFSDMENLDLSPLRGVLAGIEDSESMRAIIAEILSFASGKWLNNEEFLGINIKQSLPEDQEELVQAIDPILEHLNATTKETVIADLTEFIDEIEALATAYPEIEKLAESDYSDPKNMSMASFTAITDAIEKTTIAKEIVANLLSTAGEKWAAGQEFMGLNIEEQLPDDLKGVLKPAFEAFAATTKETVVADLRSFIALIEDVQSIMIDIDEFSKQSFDEDNIQNLDATTIRNIVEVIDKSTSSLTKPIIASLIANAGEKWYAGQSFMGFNIIEQLPEDYKHSLDDVLADMKDTTVENLTDNLNGFADCIVSIVKAEKYIVALRSGSISLTESSDALAEVLSTITENNKDFVVSIMSDAINGFISDEGTAQAITGLVSGVIDELVSANEEAIGSVSEAVQEYAEALNEIVNYISSDDVEVSADDIAEAALNSETLSNAINNYTSEEGFSTINLDEDRKSAIDNAIDGYAAEHEEELTDEQKQTLNSVKKLFGIED